MVPARYAAVWFCVRQRRLGIKVAAGEARVDLKPLYLLTREWPPLQEFWQSVPLAEEMSMQAPQDIRAKYLRRCLDELARRESQGLSVRLRLIYPDALAMAGRLNRPMPGSPIWLRATPPGAARPTAACAALCRVRRVAPGLRGPRPVLDGGSPPSLDAYLLLIQACLRLNLGLCALENGARSRVGLPAIPALTLAAASVWGAYGHADRALHLLSRLPVKVDEELMAQVLRQTGRINERTSSRAGPSATRRRH